MLASSLCFFNALRWLPLADATAINYTTPVLVIVLSVIVLKERMTTRALRVRRRGHRRHAADRAARRIDLARRGAARARRRGLLRRVPDS